MTTIMEGVEAIPVHVANAHELKTPAGPADIEIVTQTYVLKTGIRQGNDSLVARILDRDPARTQAIILVSDTTYLCHTSNLADAAIGDSSNAAGIPQDGFIATKVAPIGPLHTTDPLWAVVSSDKAGTGVMVSVIIERKRA